MPVRGRSMVGLVCLVLGLSSCGGGTSSPPAVSPTVTGTTPVGPAPAGCEPSSQQALVAADLTFDRKCMSVPAHRETFLTLTNNDPGESHSIAIYRWDSCFAQAVRAGDPAGCADPQEGRRYEGDVVTSGQLTYHILGLRAGRYAFICTVHPSMHGKLNAV